MRIIESDDEVIGKIEHHEQVKAAERERTCVDTDNRKVLLIHTGGTIGMFKDEEGKFRPEKGRFKQFLESYPYFSDENETYFTAQDEFMITPQSIFKKKIWYKYYELDTLIDSTNMNIDRINSLLAILEAHYDEYDAFVVFHGTDTMSYTASALSFMIENLRKTIVLTGAQVPIGETRNDSINNILCALTIAGHYIIPEVLVVFDNKLLRGNRTTKVSASSFHSFKSPNFYPLATLGLKIQIRWEAVLPSRYDQPTTFHRLSQDISLIKLTPLGFTPPPSCKFLVIESFGVGNIPTEGPFYEWVKSISALPEDKRTIIVNISQVYQSVILNSYATGYEAEKLGLISGSDMTCEAALAKLSFLASKQLKFAQIKTTMAKSMRGQLTESEDRTAMQLENYVLNCMMRLQKNFLKQPDRLKLLLHQVVYPKLVLEKVSQQATTRMLEFGLSPRHVFEDGATLLHNFCRLPLKDDSAFYLEALIDGGADINKVDKAGHSALFYALQTLKQSVAEILHERGGVLTTTTERVFKAIRKEEINLLRAMADFGDKFPYSNVEKRNCLVYAILQGKRQIVQFFKSESGIMRTLSSERDIYGNDAAFYAKELDKSV